jgi:hypothetical protein
VTHVEHRSAVWLALKIWMPCNGTLAFVFWLYTWPRNTLLAKSIFTPQMLLTDLFGIAFCANGSGLRFSGLGANAILADQVWLTAVRCVAEVSRATEGALCEFVNE